MANRTSGKRIRTAAPKRKRVSSNRKSLFRYPWLYSYIITIAAVLCIAYFADTLFIGFSVIAFLLCGAILTSIASAWTTINFIRHYPVVMITIMAIPTLCQITLIAYPCPPDVQLTLIISTIVISITGQIYLIIQAIRNPRLIIRPLKLGIYGLILFASGVLLSFQLPRPTTSFPDLLAPTSPAPATTTPP